MCIFDSSYTQPDTPLNEFCYWLRLHMRVIGRRARVHLVIQFHTLWHLSRVITFCLRTFCHVLWTHHWPSWQFYPAFPDTNLFKLQSVHPIKSHVAIQSWSMQPKGKYLMRFQGKATTIVKSKKISNDQELIQSDPISCPQNQKGNN